MSQKKKILFPTDFSENAGRAFPLAKYLANVFEAEVFILHVMEPPAIKFISGYDEDDVRKKATAMLDKFIAKHDDNEKVIWNKMIKVGRPFQAISDAAGEVAADYIVMGTHGLSGVAEFFIGTNASRVIRSSPCPVLTVRGDLDHLAFKKILLPIDLTKETGEKVVKGVEFAKMFNAEVTIISVCLSKDEDDHKKLRRRLDKAAAYVKSKEIAVETSMLISKENPGDLVMNYAKEIGADLTVIMAQQEKDIRETILGTDAAHIVNNSPIPVLCLKPMKEYHESHFSSAVFG